MKIPKEEFRERIRKIQEKMIESRIDVCLVYGDEYRREYLRYVSNYWPIFERGMLVIPGKGEPILLCAPECAKVASEMSPWQDIRNIKDFTCVTVPDEIDYSLAKFSSFNSIYKELTAKRKIKRVGLVGLTAIPINIYKSLKSAFSRTDFENMDNLLNELRLIKSKNEITCLKKAAYAADRGFEAIRKACAPGRTELEISAEAYRAAIAAGAESVAFVVFGSGYRSNTIVGRPSNKVVKNGEMIMACVAVQYEGYIASAEYPFVAGKMNDQQRYLIDALVVAEDKALKYLKAGRPAKEFVKAVKSHFAEKKLTKYDVYPPLHGIGYAEAESPYPDENSKIIFKAGMTVNTDISLFGTPWGSNRIEEGFVITDDGYEVLSPLVRDLCKTWLEKEL